MNYMRGLYSFYASIIILFITLALIPFVFNFFSDRALMLRDYYMEEYIESSYEYKYKIGYLILDSNRLVVYNRGLIEINITQVLIEGKVVNWSLIIYRDGWVDDTVIYPGELGILSVDGLLNGRLTIVSGSRLIFIDL